jgi:periplasmic protein TonB
MPFEAFLSQDQNRPRRGRQVTVALSLVLHAGLATAAIVYSFWHVDVLSPPTVTVTFLNNSPPPPPPPPPPKKRTAAQTKPVVVKDIVQPKPNEIVQPKAKPVEEPKEEDGEEGGEEGGVAGGVVGGVAGGVAVAAAPPAARPPPPPPKPEEIAPKFLPPNIAGQQLLTDPRKDAQYRVALPPALATAGMRLWAMLKVCVSEEGNVFDVKVIKSMDVTADSLLQAKIKTWRYKPVSIDGHAVRFCYNFRYEHVPQ